MVSFLKKMPRAPTCITSKPTNYITYWPMIEPKESRQIGQVTTSEAAIMVRRQKHCMMLFWEQGLIKAGAPHSCVQWNQAPIFQQQGLIESNYVFYSPDKESLCHFDVIKRLSTTHFICFLATSSCNGCSIIQWLWFVASFRVRLLPILSKNTLTWDRFFF